MNRRLFLIFWFCAIFPIIGFTSCHRHSHNEDTRYERAVVVYMAAENSLGGSFHQQDIDEMIEAAGDVAPNSKLIIYVDDMELPRILSVEQQSGRRPVCKALHAYDAEQNSGDVATLRTVMEWVTDNAEAKSYGLVFWSHGDAWLPAKSPVMRSICIDNGRNSGSNSGTKMEIADVAEVLAGFPRLEFIMFDACFMQAVEVAYELRHAAKYIIASPAEIPNPGAPYERMVKPMFAQPFDAEGVIDAYYRLYNDSVMSVWQGSSARYGISLSVVDCDWLDELADATQSMLVKYVVPGEEIYLKGVQRYYPLSSRYRPEYYDMNGVMRRVITDEEDYASWRRVYDKAVPYRCSTPWWFSNDAYTQYVDMSNYGGVSCYVPQQSAVYTKLNESFQATSWYEVSGWAQLGW